MALNNVHNEIGYFLPINDNRSFIEKALPFDRMDTIERISIIAMLALTALYITNQTSLTAYLAAGGSSLGIYIAMFATRLYYTNKYETEEYQRIGYIQDFDINMRMRALCPEIDFDYE